MTGISRQCGTLRQSLQRDRGLQLGESRSLAVLSLLLLQQASLLAFQLLDARAFHSGLSLTERHGLRMGVPGLLPSRQRLLDAHQHL